MARKKLTPETRITSTSDFTVQDIIEAVADSIPAGAPRKNIEKVVKETVRPCAIGGVPTVEAGAGGMSDGNTRRFRNGRLVGGAGCPDAGLTDAPEEERKAPRRDEVFGNVPAIVGRMATNKDGDCVSRDPAARVPIDEGAKLATSSKWKDVVLQNGEVWTPYTSRRFLPAQYLGLMNAFNGNIDAAIARRYSLRDCFRLLDNEIEKLDFMSTHWRTAYMERSRFLPVDTVKEIFAQYLSALSDNVNDRSKCEFKPRTGEYWRKIQGEGRITLWKESRHHDEGDNGASSDTVTIEPTDWLVRLNRRIEIAMRKTEAITSYRGALKVLRDHMPDVSMGTFKDHEGFTRFWLPKAWKEAFKRQGAYYTLKALVVNCHVRYTTESGNWRNKTTTAADSAREGLDKLAGLLDTGAPAYVIHAILKKSIETSKFDVAKFLRSIRRY